MDGAARAQDRASTVHGLWKATLEQVHTKRCHLQYLYRRSPSKEKSTIFTSNKKAHTGFGPVLRRHQPEREAVWPLGSRELGCTLSLGGRGIRWQRWAGGQPPEQGEGGTWWEGPWGAAPQNGDRTPASRAGMWHCLDKPLGQAGWPTERAAFKPRRNSASTRGLSTAERGFHKQQRHALSSKDCGLTRTEELQVLRLLQGVENRLSPGCYTSQTNLCPPEKQEESFLPRSVTWHGQHHEKQESVWMGWILELRLRRGRAQITMNWLTRNSHLRRTHANTFHRKKANSLESRM